MEYGKWLTKKPKFDAECMLIAGRHIKFKGIKPRIDYDFWLIKRLDGEDEDGKLGWYWGLIDEDGTEHGHIAELKADIYYIIPEPNV